MTKRRILVTGASGYIGGCTVVQLAQDKNNELIAYCRSAHTAASLAQIFLKHVQALALPWTAAQQDRVRVVIAGNDYAAGCGSLTCEVLVHCAASLNYLDRDESLAVNVEMTRSLLAGLRSRPFIVYVSTAFAAGTGGAGIIPEGPLAVTTEDVNGYTYSKRLAEDVIRTSGLPFTIVRPSVVIGHSQSGIYSGRSIGLYQFLDALRRFDESLFKEHWHLMMPHWPLPLVHIDTVLSSLQRCVEEQHNGLYVNVVNHGDPLPSAHAFIETVFAQLDDAPELTFHKVGTSLPRQAALPFHLLARLQQSNLAMADQEWHWQHDTLDKSACVAPDIASVLRCVRSYLSDTPSIMSRWSRCE